jgi:hypothetical protein
MAGAPSLVPNLMEERLLRKTPTNLPCFVFYSPMIGQSVLQILSHA